MDDVNIDRILENMFVIMLITHKKMLRMDLGGRPDNLTRLHLAVMGELGQNKYADDDKTPVEPPGGLLSFARYCRETPG
jgi:hypothetical protein